MQRDVGSRSTRRGPRRPGLWVAALAIALAAAGCTADAQDATGSPGNAAGRVSARLNEVADAVALVTGDTPGAVSVGVSRALFATAPVVVVARGDDQPAVAAGAMHAARLGLPLLLVDVTRDAANAGTPSGSPSGDTSASGANPAPLPETLTAEISRLHPRAVLAMGDVAARLGQLPDVRVVTDAAKLPPLAPPDGASSVAVLVRGGRENPSSAAATASGKAAGAQVIPVAGTDPRADPDAIVALAEQRPARVLAVGAGFGPVDRLTGRLAVAETGVQLPAGGQVLFPGHRLVALYGHPGTASLGVLGEQGVTASIARAKKMAAKYRPLSSVPVVPMFEIIATTAQGSPGKDGDYSGEASLELLRPWVRKASAAGLYVVLDLQPGRARLLAQAKLYTELLRLPHVGLALDPEWRLGPHDQPRGHIGSVDSSEINGVISWLADLTAKARLPQKLLVLHQFQLRMIGSEEGLNLTHDEIQVLIHMDGQGSPALKDGTWRAVTEAAPKGMPFGWKNFYDEDHPMLTPVQTMKKKPTPLMISYQ